ncbi:uncharacterized protein BJ212DRAFT_943701 [Suillus subaureus]|uniref:Uncharacterized protein n=1 Tax=Suillus subaureus TaxID=48587 RepID=A0A9P7AK69_9AGAM|nr:uncharacterized protein BJ212DRAFT_943701 [Suillus subaureus]KAG1791145.1 hypothetical protein BJ212DRAFT_943701 [Suillus subaureus]
MPSGPRPGAPIGYLSALFRSPLNVDEAIELQNCPGPIISFIAVLMLSMLLQCGTGRSYLLLVSLTLLVKWPGASRTKNRGFAWCCLFAACLLVTMAVLAPTRLITARSQYFYRV